MRVSGLMYALTLCLCAVPMLIAPSATQAAEGPNLPPAEYKPLPVGTNVRYGTWRYYVTDNKDFKLAIQKETSVRGNLNEDVRIKLYGIFLKSGDYLYTTDSTYPFEASVGDDDVETIKHFWPLKVGNKVSVEITETHSENGDTRDWQISLAVLRTEIISMDGISYATYVISETGVGEAYDSGQTSISQSIYEATHWYQPDAGVIIKSDTLCKKKCGQFGVDGQFSGYRLDSIGYPSRTSTHVLKGIDVENGVDKALLAKIQSLKREVELAHKAGEAEGDKARTAKINLLKQEAEKARSAEIASLRKQLEEALNDRKTAQASKKKDKAANAFAGIDFGNYHALVIGINNYKNLPKLKTAVNDARGVAKILEEDYGFKVTTMIDPDRLDIIDAFDELQETLTDADNLLIYYAGHGWLNEEVDRGYWLPVDAKPKRRGGWVSNVTVTDTLKGLSAKHVMVVADSCFSGTLVRGANIGTRKRKGDYWKKMASKWARVAITSGGLEPVADKGGSGYSPFAKAFIDVLRDNVFIMDGLQLFGKMRRPVMIAAEQTPQYSDVRNAGHDGGDFLFVRKK